MESEYIIHPLYPVPDTRRFMHFKTNGKRIRCIPVVDADMIMRFVFENMHLMCEIEKSHNFINSFEFINEESEQYFFTELKKGPSFPRTRVQDGIFTVGKRTLLLNLPSTIDTCGSTYQFIERVAGENFSFVDYTGRISTIVFKNEDSRTQFINSLSANY